MADGMIERINELYNKAKTEGLTDEELEEQAALRQAYVAAFRRNFREQLDNIDIENPDGTIENLGEKHANGMNGASAEDPEEA